MAEPKQTSPKPVAFFLDYQGLLSDVERLVKGESNPFFNSKYVPLKDVLAEAKRICKEHNFIFIQKPYVINTASKDQVGDVKPALSTLLIHKSGEIIDGYITLPCKDPNDPQKLGGAITYMRRYSLTTMLGIEEADDDANAASGKKPKKGAQPVDPDEAPF